MKIKPKKKEKDTRKEFAVVLLLFFGLEARLVYPFIYHIMCDTGGGDRESYGICVQVSGQVGR